jgi:hypothetical protein
MPYKTLKTNLHDAGLDIVHGFDAVAYNQSVDEHTLPDFGRDDTQAFLVGNTRQFWPVFIEFLSENPDWLDAEDPIDRYTEKQIGTTVDTIEPKTEIIWAHRAEPDFFPMRKVAEEAEFAAGSPCEMSIHPDYGLWFGLRAVVVLDRRVELISEKMSSEQKPCIECHEPCVTQLNIALDKEDATWRDWARVRLSCPASPEAQYADNELMYHYLKDRRYLRRGVRLHGSFLFDRRVAVE